MTASNLNRVQERFIPNLGDMAQEISVDGFLSHAARMYRQRDFVLADNPRKEFSYFGGQNGEYSVSFVLAPGAGELDVTRASLVNRIRKVELLRNLAYLRGEITAFYEPKVGREVMDEIEAKVGKITSPVYQHRKGINLDFARDPSGDFKGFSLCRMVLCEPAKENRRISFSKHTGNLMIKYDHKSSHLLLKWLSNGFSDLVASLITKAQAINVDCARYLDEDSSKTLLRERTDFTREGEGYVMHHSIENADNSSLDVSHKAGFSLLFAKMANQFKEDCLADVKMNDYGSAI